MRATGTTLVPKRLVTSMRNTSILTLAVTIPLLSHVLVSTARADSTPELKPKQTIQLEVADDSQRVPVISSVAISPDGRLLATGGDDHVVRIWELDEAEVSARLLGHNDWVRAASFSPDGRLLATAGNDRQIRLWSMSESTQSQTIPEIGQNICALAFSPDGRLLAAAGFEETVVVYDVESGRVVHRLAAPGPDMRAVEFSPDGRQLAVAGRSGTIRTWDIGSGSVLQDIEAHRRRIHALAYSPDAKQIASGGEDRDVKVFSSTGGSLLATLPRRPARIETLAFCGPRRLAVGGSDNVIRLWDLPEQTEQLQLVGHTGTVTTLSWNPQTGTLISGSFDTTVRIWQLGLSGTDALSRYEYQPRNTP